MKHIVLTTLLACSIIRLYALDVSVSHANFSTDNQPFVEVYLSVIGSTVSFQPIDSIYQQATVEVLLLFKQGDKIVTFDKYTLQSPKADFDLNFVDSKRFALPNGTYMLEVTVTDLNQSENVFHHAKEVQVAFSGKALELSDIQLLKSFKQSDASSDFTKSGFFLEPLPGHFYDKNDQHLQFYCEIYGASSFIGDRFALRYTVLEEGKTTNPKVMLVGYQKCDPSVVNPILIKKDISKLASGNYQLVLEVRDRNNGLLLSKQIPFQRSNPYLNIDKVPLSDQELSQEFVNGMNQEDLQYSLKALLPIAPQNETEVLNLVVANKEDLVAQRRYLFSFWARKNPNNPQMAFEEYMRVAKAVDKKFRSGFGFGFETDRGYIFLKYGRPDDAISVDNEQTAPPYEIWSYYDFPKTNQTNVKFLFYNRSLASNDFLLLHSTAIGEINNPQWEVELYKQAPNEIEGDNYLDATQMQDGINRNARRYFNDF